MQEIFQIFRILFLHERTDLIRGEYMGCAAEVTVYLNVLPFFYHPGQLLLSQADQCSAHPVTGTVAAVLCFGGANRI